MSENAEKDKERKAAELASEARSTIERAKEQIRKNQELLDRLKQQRPKE